MAYMRSYGGISATRVLVANFVMKPDTNLEEGRWAEGGIAEATLSR